MEAVFENFNLWKDDTEENGRPFIVACKDREVTNKERWALVSLSEEEAKQVYECLQKYFK